MRCGVFISDHSSSTFAHDWPEQKSHANIIKDDYQYVVPGVRLPRQHLERA